ncbi:MAG TPA: hypothetical protein VFW44_19260 [Bryobacteraceae bacterium]|nr:hypothetical protein [Bryobacteraceae bacterium]
MLQSTLVTFLVAAGLLGPQSGAYRVEHQPVAGGAELITVYGRLHQPIAGAQGFTNREEEVPLLAVLRDSLGDNDPANDRLRYVWILTSTRPTLWQRTASALSFGYFRAGGKRHANQVPSPAIDLASPARSVYRNLAADSIQVLEFDPLGAAIRSTTRTYRGNSTDYNKLQVYQALAILDNLERGPMSASALPEDQFRKIYARLGLSTHLFGGLVREPMLGKYYDKQASALAEARGHNWEMLRQRAEMNGLIFEPLALGTSDTNLSTPSQALLWIAKSDLDDRAAHRFNSQFLGIANPWTDDRLMHWTGYTETRYFNEENQPVADGTPGARSEELIPLALYSLDYPRVPLLLADFRDSFKPKRREMMSEGATSVVTGVFGLTRFGNPEYFAAEAVWNFVRGRHGAATNRSARLQAYSGAREFLSVDSRLDPALKAELQRHLDRLALNPRENEVAREAELAREQYAALLSRLDSASGEAKLERDRRKEFEAATQPAGERFFKNLARVFTRGPQVDPQNPDATVLAELDAQRRAAYHMEFLDRILASSPAPDVVWDSDEIGRSVEALATNDAGPKAQELISRVCARAVGGNLQVTCVRALDREDAARDTEKRPVAASASLAASR